MFAPAVLFTEPEIGSVGLSEQTAQNAGIPVKTAVYPFMALGKALADRHREGFVKWVVEPTTGRLLGAHAIGHHATDLIAEAAVAIKAEMTIDQFREIIHAHPTLSEA